MFTLNFLRNSLLNSVNLSRSSLAVSSRSLQLFKKPNEGKKDAADEEEEENLPVQISLEEMDEERDPELEQKRIQRMQNKSRLLTSHRNMLHDKVPYNRSESWIHDTLKYKRMMYGRYGKESGIDPRICFYTNVELAEKKEYERVGFPKTIQEMMAISSEEKTLKSEKVKARDDAIAQNLLKLEQWKFDLENKKNKKEEEARVAKERKDRLIEEVRQHFGYTIHPKDEKFKELLEKKEKEQRKAMKEAKKLKKEADLLSKIAEKGTKKSDDKKSEKIHNDDDEK